MNDKETIFFYERKYYFLSNFSSFAIEWKGKLYMTSEHVYQSEKFEDEEIRESIRNSRSAHDALNLSHIHKEQYRKDWTLVKLSIMKEILREKAKQHSHISDMLIQSGDKILVEDSPLDNFWGYGPNKDGENNLGKLWMEIRGEVKINML